MTFRSLVLIFALAFAFDAQAYSERFTRTFRVPPDFFFAGHLALDAPSPPLNPIGVAPSPDEQPSTAKQILEAQGITFPEDTSAFFNPVTSLLTVTNVTPNLDLVEAFVEVLQLHQPVTLAHQLIILEGPGEIIRRVNAAASRTANADKELTTLLDYAKNPGSSVRVVADAFLETKSGTRSSTNAVREHVHASFFSLDTNSRANASWDRRLLGLTFEVGPTLAPDSLTIDNDLVVEFHPVSPNTRQMRVTDPLTAREAEFPFSLTAGAEFKTSLHTSSGATKIVGVTKPVGLADEKANVLWAAFLTTTIRRVDTFPQPQPPLKAAPPGMTSVAFRAPPGMLESLMENSTLPLREWLQKEHGIAFPMGSVLEQKNEYLHVTHTPGAIEAIGVLLARAEATAPKTAAFTLHTIEAPAALLRDLARQSAAADADDTAMFTTAEAAAARGEARFIDSIFLETQSGLRGSLKSIREHIFISEFAITDKNQPEIFFEMRDVGSIIEVDPYLSPDGHTVELNFSHELHPAPPETRAAHFRDPASGQPFAMPATDFHVLKTNCSLTLTKGGTKLVSLHKPTGRDAEGKLWATFLKCDVVPQVAKNPSRVLVDPGRLFTRSFRVNQSALLKLMEPAPDTNKSAMQVFKEAGIEFPGGASVYYGPPTSLIIVRNTSENLRRVESFLATLGGGEEPDSASDIQDNQRLETRVYKVTPDFLTREPKLGETAVGQLIDDPFAATPPDRTERRRPSILESKGIYFPEGASAAFNPANSTLIVRNTPQNLAKVEAYLDELAKLAPKTVTVTTHMIQAPGPLLRRLTAQAASKSNHRAELDELLAAVRKGEAQSLGTNRIETKPGVIARTQQGMEHTALADVRISKEGAPEIITETRNVGLKVELEATVGPDGQLVELQIAPEFHTAAPFEHREHILDTQGRRLEFPLTDYFVSKTTTGITIIDGSARLLSLYKPTGKPEFEKEDILQAIFITCDILRVGQ